MLPVEFIDIMQQQLGAQAPELFHALEQEPVTSIRLNDKIDELSFDADIDEVPWHYDGYYLSERPQFTLDPLMHAGCYYVQEASSMLIQRALEQYVSEDSVVLDLCAAPGGKATLISQYLGAQGLLVANEVVRQRVFILSENIQKWGNGNTVVTHNAPALFGEALPNTFDCVLVDAPCSGEGMFRKDEQAIAEWSPRNVRLCVDRQRTILHDMWDALKPGGILIYSTCTFNRHECEENALWIADELGADILPLGLDPSWGITESIAGYHCYPHLVRGEGFYLCVLRKRRRDFAPLNLRRAKKPNSTPITAEDRELVRSWLTHPDDWALRQLDRFITAYPAKYKELIDYMSTRFLCISLGFGLAEERGKHFAPQHSLSMSKATRLEAFPQLELNLESALAYLRTEALPLTNLPLGLLLVTYHGVPLGFVKNVGSRCNNLYPNEWRIRNL